MTQIQKNWINNITKTVITALLISAIGVSISFYVDFRVNEAKQDKINIELQQNINENTKLINTNITKCDEIELIQDTLISQNSNEHKILAGEIHSLSKNIQTLTFVVSKYNSDVRHDILELKKLQLYGPDLTYEEKFKQAGAEFTQQYN